MRLLYLLSTTACFAPPERARGPVAAQDDELDGLDEPGDDDEAESDAADADNEGDDAGESADGDEGAESVAAAGDAEDAEDADADDEPARGRQNARQPRRQGRASEVVRTLRERAQTAEAAQRDLTARLNALEAKFTAPQQQQAPQRTAREEQEYLATMTVEERLEYKQQKFFEQMQQQTAQTTRTVAETNDRQQFNAKLSELPRLKKYTDQVEAKYQEIIRNGGYVPRLGVLTYLLGEKAMQRLASGDLRPGSRERVRRQRVAPTNARGDAAPTRGGSRTKSFEERFGDTPI